MRVTEITVHGFFAGFIALWLALVVGAATVWDRFEADIVLQGALISQGVLALCFAVTLWKRTHLVSLQFTSVGVGP